MRFTRAAIKSIDRASAEEYGLPTIVLMENAARAALGAARAQLRLAGRPGPVALCCGPGGNGGDGFALARLLHNAGMEVAILLASERSRVAGDAMTNLVVAERMGLPIFGFDAAAPVESLARFERACAGPALVVDALFGAGLDRALSPAHAQVVAWIEARRLEGARALAIDAPSGLDCDTGEPLGASCVRADATITFCGPKMGFANPASAPYLGEVSVGDIGAPVELLRRYASP